MMKRKTITIQTDGELSVVDEIAIADRLTELLRELGHAEAIISID
jgi:hypothetical protein